MWNADLRANTNLIEIKVVAGFYGCSETSTDANLFNTWGYYHKWLVMAGSPSPPGYTGQIIFGGGCTNRHAGHGLLGLNVNGLSNLKIIHIEKVKYHGQSQLGMNSDWAGLSSIEEIKADTAHVVSDIDLSGPKPNVRIIDFNNNKVGFASGSSGIVDLSGAGPGLEHVGFYKNYLHEIYLNSVVDLDVLRQLGQPGGTQNFRVGCNGSNGCAPGSTVILVHVGTQARANYANGWSTLTHDVIPGSGFYGTQQAHFVI